MSSRSKKLSSLILCALLVSNQADAVQLVPGADRQHVQVNVSAREANRLAIDGRRIANVVPAQPGLLVAKKDEATGAMYFTLALEQATTGAVTVFVTDDQAVTYKLILVPRPIPGEEIILQPPADKSAGMKRSGSADGRALSYQRRVKDIILLMADEDAGESGADKVPVNKEVPLWQEGQLVLVAKFLEGDIVGERYRLTNVSQAPMLVAEQELYRRGVRAVSIRDHTLPPGDSTEIYVVRSRRDHE